MMEHRWPDLSHVRRFNVRFRTDRATDVCNVPLGSDIRNFVCLVEGSHGEICSACRRPREFTHLWSPDNLSRPAELVRFDHSRLQRWAVEWRDVTFWERLAEARDRPSRVRPPSRLRPLWRPAGPTTAGFIRRVGCRPRPGPNADGTNRSWADGIAKKADKTEQILVTTRAKATERHDQLPPVFRAAKP